MPKKKNYSAPLPSLDLEFEKLIECTELASRLLEVIQDKVWKEQENYPEALWSSWMDCRTDISRIMEKYEWALHDLDEFKNNYTRGFNSVRKIG